MTALRLGVDVGGTNTDAVVVDEAGAVLASHKVPTTPEPMDGIRAAMSSVLPVCTRLPWPNIFSVATTRTPVPVIRPEFSCVPSDDCAPAWALFWYSRSSNTARLRL